MSAHTGLQFKRLFLLLVLARALTGAPALSSPEAVADCRAEHARDAPGYVLCLEIALQSRDGAPHDAGDDPPMADDNPSVAQRIGAEQVRKEEDDELSVQIVGTDYSARGLGTFRMEDGQVWRETTASPARKHLDPDREYAARIVRGKLGGYRMHVDGVRWMKTVERIE